MEDVSILLLSGILIVLIAVAAFFSGSETSMMAVNRYRLRHLADDDGTRAPCRPPTCWNGRTACWA